jgi:DNA polymerase
MIYNVVISQPDDAAAFRSAARRLLGAGVAPPDIAWSNDATLFPEPLPAGERTLAVPRAFSHLVEAVACHRDDARWSLLYQALWRIDQGERCLMERVSDPIVHRLRRMEAAIRRDQHRMTAFVRFRKISDPSGELFLAWYEPQHRVLRRAAGFFIDRFASMRFSILTPDLTLVWDRGIKTIAPGLRPGDQPTEDAVEDWWRQYYSASFNPARTNVRLMQSHMPKTYWKNLPEARSINDLVAAAGARTDRMITQAPLPTNPCSD